MVIMADDLHDFLEEQNITTKLWALSFPGACFPPRGPHYRSAPQESHEDRQP